MVEIASFYRFIPLPETAELRSQLQSAAMRHQLKGTVLLASEGINATIAGAPEPLAGFLGWLQLQPNLGDLTIKFSRARTAPFRRLRVKLKKQILSFRPEGGDPSLGTGTRVSPQDWNELIERPDVLVLDVRNDYEIRVGSFNGAVNPRTQSFADFTAYVDERLGADKQRPVAMYCTGGIRCEKSSAYMLSQGFERVYQLDGGVLAYLEQVDREQSRWQGECFVFDQRVSLDHDLQPGAHRLCYACRTPLSVEDLQHERYQAGVSCGYCYAHKSSADRARYAMRQAQQEQDSADENR